MFFQKIIFSKGKLNAKCIQFAFVFFWSNSLAAREIHLKGE